MLTLLILACSSGPPSGNNLEALLDEYELVLGEAHELVDGYVVDVDGAADVDAVSEFQTTYAGEVDHALEDLEHVLADLGG